MLTQKRQQWEIKLSCGKLSLHKYPPISSNLNRWGEPTVYSFCFTLPWLCFSTTTLRSCPGQPHRTAFLLPPTAHALPVLTSSFDKCNLQMTFSSACVLSGFSCVRLLVTLWTLWTARLLCPWDSPGKKEYWSG